MKRKKEVTVCGVSLNKVNVQVLSKALSNVKNEPVELLSLEDGGSYEAIGAAVTDLTNYVKATTPVADDILQCDLCGGGSSVEFDSCPYCGDPGEVQASDKSSIGYQQVDEEEEEVEEVREVQEEDDPTEITSPLSVLSNSTEETLNEELLRIHSAQETGAHAMWMMSISLRKIYEEDLWKLRNDEEGKPKYKSFTKFLSVEVQLHERTVWRLIEIAKQFKETQLKKYGVTILRGLLAAPKEDREDILEKIDAGELSGSRSIDSEIKKLRKVRGVKVLGGAATQKDSKVGKAAMKASEVAAEKAEKKKTITVPFPIGRKTIKLYAYVKEKGDAPKRAKKVLERPWGKLECVNGVTLYLAVVENKDGELDMTVEARREE